VILADTSVWIGHLRKHDATLADLLEAGRITTHAFVVGELALGNLRRREEILGLLQDLPRSGQATDEEVLGFIARHRLSGAGIGYVDAHLLAATALTPGSRLWTFDRRLSAAAERLDLHVSRDR